MYDTRPMKRIDEEKQKPGLERLLRECDVETYRGSGPGGQHRNRRDSAVRLTHRATGIVVTATERRSQHQNKEVALERLAAKLAARARKRKPRVATKPSKSARDKRITAKKVRSTIKSARRAPRVGGDAGE